MSVKGTGFRCAKTVSVSNRTPVKELILRAIYDLLRVSESERRQPLHRYIYSSGACDRQIQKRSQKSYRLDESQALKLKSLSSLDPQLAELIIERTQEVPRLSNGIYGSPEREIDRKVRAS